VKTTRKARGGQAVYLELIRRFPLRPIRSDEELDRAIAVVDGLLDRTDLNQDERDYLDVLSDLIERYESEAYPVPPASDAEVLAHLIEARGTTQAQVARETKLAESTISEVLAGKRELNRTHIGQLARYFGVGPAVFSFKG
jgi:HTH-type transcriptional regulator/antitoxin HigA